MEVKYLFPHAPSLQRQCGSLLVRVESLSVLVDFPFLPLSGSIDSVDDDGGGGVDLLLPFGLLDSPEEFAQVDLLIVTQPDGILALPFLRRIWHGRVFISEALLEYARALFELWCGYADEATPFQASDQVSNSVPLHQLFTRSEMLLALESVTSVRHGENIHVFDNLNLRPFPSGYAPGSTNWLLNVAERSILVFGDSCNVAGRISDSLSLRELPPVDLCLVTGRISSSDTRTYQQSLDELCMNLGVLVRDGKSVAVVCPVHLLFDAVERLHSMLKALGNAKTRFVLYSNVSEMIRRIPLLSEWVSMLSVEADFREKLLTVTPGVASELAELIPLIQKPPVVIFQTSIDIMTGSSLAALCEHFAQKSNRISTIFNLDGFLSEKACGFLPFVGKAEVSLLTIPYDPIMPGSEFQSIVDTQISPKTLVVPEFVISEMIVSSSFYVKWTRDVTRSIVTYPTSASEPVTVKIEMPEGSLKSFMSQDLYLKLEALFQTGCGPVVFTASCQPTQVTTQATSNQVVIDKLEQLPRSESFPFWRNFILEKLVSFGICLASEGETKYSARNSPFGNLELNLAGDKIVISAQTWTHCEMLKRALIFDGQS